MGRSRGRRRGERRDLCISQFLQRTVNSPLLSKMAKGNIGLQTSDLFCIRNAFTWPILLNRKTSGSLSKTQSEYFYPLFPYRFASYGLKYKHHRLACGFYEGKEAAWKGDHRYFKFLHGSAAGC